MVRNIHPKSPCTPLINNTPPRSFQRQRLGHLSPCLHTSGVESVFESEEKGGSDYALSYLGADAYLVGKEMRLAFEIR